MTTRSLFLAAAGIFGVFLACSAAPVKAKTLCSPNKGSYCRCQDREQGEKICAADGKSFGPCDPCESFDNPEGPLEPGDPGQEDPYPPFDSGIDKPLGDGGGTVQPTAKCGDGVVQLGEDCDDKNADDADGCNAKCKLAGAAAPSSAACPGLAVDVWGDEHQPTLASSTAGSGNRKTTASCAASGSTASTGSTAADRVFHVTVHKSGSMTVALTNVDYNAFMYVAATCDDTAETTISCVNKIDGVGNETLKFSVADGKSYAVFVDGALKSGSGDTSQTTGNFTITFSIQ